jgi:hypothetical protein
MGFLFCTQVVVIKQGRTAEVTFNSTSNNSKATTPVYSRYTMAKNVEIAVEQIHTKKVWLTWKRESSEI